LAGKFDQSGRANQRRFDLASLETINNNKKNTPTIWKRVSDIEKTLPGTVIASADDDDDNGGARDPTWRPPIGRGLTGDARRRSVRYPYCYDGIRAFRFARDDHDAFITIFLQGIINLRRSSCCVSSSGGGGVLRK